MANVVVAGGGMCGTAAAVMLADDGHDVTVIERDAAPPPPDVEQAYHDWDRRSVAQFSLAHWLHPRGTAILRDHVPEAYRLLTEHGGFRFNFVEYIASLSPVVSMEPGDERFELVTGRRSTLEWAMANAGELHPNVTMRRGVAIAGLLADGDGDGPPHVTGVRLADGTELRADLVVDATGRRSPTPDWLAEIGAAAPHEDAEDSGFAYYGRYFRGEMPGFLGGLLAPYGSFSILTLPADNDTWAVTLYGLSDDKPLRRFRDPEVFERVVQACPLHAHWLAGEPITEMKSMAGVVDRHRTFVVDGTPVVTGMLTIADAASCTNPSLGRGITLGLMHTQVMRECVRDHADPTELALAFHERSESEVTTWHEDTVAVDRRRVREMRQYRNGVVPEPTHDERIADTMQAAMGMDPLVTRATLEVLSCLTPKERVMARPGFVDRLETLMGEIDFAPLPGPDRDELLELVS